MRKTYVIDGIKYVAVEREAEVGDYVVIVDAWLSHNKYANGDIIEVHRVFEDGIENDLVKAVNNKSGYITSREYVVIEPLESEATPSVTDLLANLARRVASLESQLSDTQHNVEKLAEELANVKHLTEEPATPDEAIPQYWAEALIRFYGGNR
jgi:hypothetical protein